MPCGIGDFVFRTAVAHTARGDGCQEGCGIEGAQTYGKWITGLREVNRPFKPTKPATGRWRLKRL